MTPHILVVDDEAQIAELLSTYLSSQGMRVSAAHDGKTMREVLAREPVDLVLLDIGLPGEDGLSLARYLREHWTVGIIMVTGRGESVDRIVGLEVGADDYVTKPFDLRELLARIRSVLRRLQPAESVPASNEMRDGIGKALRFAGWCLDLQQRTLTSPQGERVPLTTGEFDLLSAFAAHANRVLSRDQLCQLLYDRDAGPFDRAVDVQVGRLRRKIEADSSAPEIIKSVRGVGYIFTANIQRG